jgi:hypothetical protein
MMGSAELLIVGLIIALILFFIFKAGQWYGAYMKNKEIDNNNSR